MYTNENYYGFLIDNIPNLKQCRSVSGGEGVVYFLNDSFVVKEYKTLEDWNAFENVFNSYCKEMQTFAESGYSLPKIYAWAQIPNINYFLNNDKNKYNYRQYKGYKEHFQSRWLHWS